MGTVKATAALLPKLAVKGGNISMTSYRNASGALVLTKADMS